MKIWNKIPIKDNGDKLIALPSYLNFLDPHPYSHLGAPYKDKTSIWKLREEVVNRLVKVNDFLISKSRGTEFQTNSAFLHRDIISRPMP